MWAYAFNVVSIDYSHRIPRVSFAIPYYFFGNSGIWRLGSKGISRRDSGSEIYRPTVDVIFNRQSIKSPKPVMNNTSDYIHINSLRTNSEKRLINAIVTASTEPNKEESEYGQSEFIELRTLFNEFINDLEKKRRVSQDGNVFLFPKRKT